MSSIVSYTVNSEIIYIDPMSATTYTDRTGYVYSGVWLVEGRDVNANIVKVWRFANRADAVLAARTSFREFTLENVSSVLQLPYGAHQSTADGTVITIHSSRDGGGVDAELDGIRYHFSWVDGINFWRVDITYKDVDGNWKWAPDTVKDLLPTCYKLAEKMGHALYP